MRLRIIASITAAAVAAIVALFIAITPAPTAPRALPSDCTALPREGTVGLASTPPMGWNGYNRFSINVTASLVKAEARALIASGMKNAGYRYIILDGGWALLRRDAAGNLQPDPAKFPDGIKAL